MEKVKSFVLGGRGGMVTLQIGTLAVLFGMFYAGVQWKHDIEDALTHRWSSVHQEIWRMQLANENPGLSVPETQPVVRLVED
jgi:hypothetical protein